MKKSFFFGLIISSLFSCQMDKREQAIEEIKATDIAFSALSEKEGMHAAFLEYIDDNGAMLRPNGYPIIGKKEVIKNFDLKDDSGYTLIWEPLYADASSSGDFGYSYGKYSLILNDTTQYGTYVSVWKKVGNKWKFVLDSGNEGLGDEEN